MKICKTEGCGRPVRSVKSCLCNACYQREYYRLHKDRKQAAQRRLRKRLREERRLQLNRYHRDWHRKTYHSQPPEGMDKRTYTMADINQQPVSGRLVYMLNHYQPSGFVGGRSK